MPNPQNLKDKGFDMHPERINKQGRPKGSILTKCLRDTLDGDGFTYFENIEIIDPSDKVPTGEKIPLGRAKIPQVTALITTLLNRALKGDLKAIQIIFDRVEGKPVQPLRHEVEIDNPWIELARRSILEDESEINISN